MISNVSRIDLEIIIGGYSIAGLLQAAINRTNCFAADTFSITFAVVPPVFGIRYWMALSTAQIEIIGSTTNLGVLERRLVFRGLIDSVRIDPILQTVCIEGRDLSALMIDTYRQQDFVNQTASEIIVSIADYHGLEAVVQPTTENVGRYYRDGYTKTALGRLSRLQSDWDVVVHLARLHNFDAYVENSSLYFQPPASEVTEVDTLSISETEQLCFERNLAVSETSSVLIQSWNSQQSAAFQSRGPSGEGTVSSNASFGASRSFLFAEANLTSGQLDERVSLFKAEIGRLANVLHIQIPCRLSITPRTVIAITDTQSSIDGLYLVENTFFRYSSTLPSRQTIRALPLGAV